MYNWEVKRFSEFSLVEFHDLIALRIDVFIIEQDCPYQELDGKDQLSLHLITSKDGQIVATTRIVPPGLSYKEPAIGRVVISK
ncbi:MAG: GNAT family N-acetyltransferase, partial [Flavobacteriales bacterium]|nr:GNAT family N-acetyltransferase [Flavobacteriales bacterium]